MRKENNILPAVIFFALSCLGKPTAQVSFAQEPKQMSAGSAIAAKQNSGSSTGKAGCVLVGIFYDENTPIVLVGDGSYYTNDYICGGLIKGISKDTVTMEYQNEECVYRVGDYIFKEDTASSESNKKPVESQELSYSQPTIVYLKEADPIAKDLISRHNKNKVLFTIATEENLFRLIMTNKKTQAVCAQMLEAINNDLGILNKLSVPLGCQRHYYLVIKMCDIADTAWKAALKGSWHQAEVLFQRVSRISQEVDLESRSTLTSARKKDEAY